MCRIELPVRDDVVEISVPFDRLGFPVQSDICRRNRGIPNADFVDETFVLQALASATLSDVQA